MHVMLDLETLGTRAGAVILSIGAVAFDKNGPSPQLPTFHMHLKIMDQMALGQHLDPDTVVWWLQQNDDARNGIVNGQSNASAAKFALTVFADWYALVDGETVWGNGADFDLPLLGDMFKRFGMPVPWKYNAGRCCRTIMGLLGKKMGAFGTKNDLAHDALADAIYQAGEVAGALRLMQETDELAWRYKELQK